MHVMQTNSVRSSAKLFSVGVHCMTLDRFHHNQPSIRIHHIELATAEMAESNGIKLLTMIEQYCLSFNFKCYILC